MFNNPSPSVEENISQICRRWIKAHFPTALIVAAALFGAAATYAQANPFQRGPAPTTASLEAASGPYAVDSSTISSPVGYGAGTVYYPANTSDGPFGLIALAPGFVNTQTANKWWGPRLASHGFVVVMINTTTLFDLPGPRSKQLLSALKDVVSRSQSSSSPYFGKVDGNRRAVMGHSMGGGGTLEAALSDATLKAAIPLAPWDVKITNFGKITVPTLIMAGQTDAVAPPSTMANVFYTSLSDVVDKAYLEVKGADHFFPNNFGPDVDKPVLGKYAVSWFKRFVDDDLRYSVFLCGAPHADDLTGASSIISSYKENCQY